MSVMVVCVNAQSLLNVRNAYGNDLNIDVDSGVEITWGDKPMDKLDIQYETTDVDTEHYIYPEKDAKMNPNLFVMNNERDEIVSVDTLSKIAVLKFGGEIPKMYRGLIVTGMTENEVYAMFVLGYKAEEGNTVTVHYRNANLNEIFFNQKLSLGGRKTMTRSTDNDTESTFMKTLKMLGLVETGLKVQLDELDINFDDTDFDIDLGLCDYIFGTSVKCEFKRILFVLGGEAKMKGSLELQPNFKAAKGLFAKDIKQMALWYPLYFVTTTTPPVPVKIDLNLDICGEINVTSEIEKAFHYAQKLGGRLKVTVGGEYDFKKGEFIPHNSLTLEVDKTKPEMKTNENVHFSIDCSVFPRFKMYFYGIKHFGVGFDFKPRTYNLEFNSCRKNDVLFFDVTAKVGTKVKSFAYVWDFEKKRNHNLAESEELCKEHVTWKSPDDIKDKTEDVVERMNYGGQSQCTFSVTDLAYEWDPQSMTPAAVDEMSIEVEKFGTIPDPAINPEYYEDIKKTTRSGSLTEGWYSYGLEYHKLNKEGDVDVPFKVETPAGENFKLVARILDGNGNVIKEVEHPTTVGFKNYDITQTLTTADGTAKATYNVRNYGAYVHEVYTGMGLKNDVVFENGTISGNMIVEGVTIPSSIFVGSGSFHAKIVPAPMRGEDRTATLSEGFDYGRWAHDKLGLSTEGMRFYDTEWNGYPATRAYIPGTGTVTYVGNCIVGLEGGEVTIRTDSFRLIEDKEE